MSNSTICIARAGRRRSKWYVRAKRRKHLLLWAGMVLALVIVLGFGVVKAIQRNVNDAESPHQLKIAINPKFHPNQ